MIAKDEGKAEKERWGNSEAETQYYFQNFSTQ